MKRIQCIMKTKQPRRGALLLVVLSILVLFALVGLTFVVSALAFNTGAQANLEKDSQANTASSEADAVLMQLLRGPRPGTFSSILTHEILRDMWGNQSVIVSDDGYAAALATQIDRPQDASGNDINQLWEIEVNESVVPFNLFRIEQYYTGSILTFTSGELKGQSHRILHYRMKFTTNMMGTTESGVVFVIDQDPIVARENLVDSNGDGGISPANGDDFVVNDPPFNGTGLGFDPTAPSGSNKRSLSLTKSGDPVALLPNILYNFPDGRVGGISIEAGGADEPYDAPDSQNMFLAYVEGGRASSAAGIMPSFHRPDLVKYWFQQYISSDPAISALDNPNAFMKNPDLDTSSWTNQPTAAQRSAAWAFRRKFMLRPTRADHPNFTGSNANFDILGNGTNARWDIDNDLDGVADSIWIDIGLPLKTDRQGRRYRPLAAIMVKDMDGLINVNAHGFYNQFASFEGTFPPSGTPNDATTLLQASAGMTNKHNQYSPSWDDNGMGTYVPQDMQLVLGSGYGPADVSLRQIFTAENAFDLMDARYKGRGGYTSTTGTPGQNAADDVRSRMDNIGLANVFNTTINNRFATPPDRLGLGRMYIDYSGRPRFQPRVDGNALTSQPTPGSFGQRTDDPYEFDLLHDYRYDTPFSYQELERVLRYEEYDSSTVIESDDRLMELAQASLTSSPTNRRLITTSSYQVPTANRVDIPFDVRTEDANMSGTPQNMLFEGKVAQARRPAPTLVTLLQERLRNENSWDPSLAAHKKRFKDKVYQLLPPEIFRGEPFDLNRLLEAPADGNGTDDIFELQRVASITFQNQYGGSVSQTPNSQFVNWLDGTSGVGSNSPTLPTPINATNPTSYSGSRQLMARYLYVMVLLLTEPDYTLPTIDASLTQAQKRELTQRRIAQWAINVVDFRDRDSVMTPFEYDLNPFTVDTGTNNDPWNVDGNLSTTEDPSFRRVVWGAEAPELVLSETLAFHDRRTKDTVWDDSSRSEKSRKPSMMMEDPDLDQYRIPQGSLFIELYNPRNLTTNNNYLPPELYDTNGLQLDRKTPGGDPVWRILITNNELNTSPAARTNIVNEIANRPDTVNFQPRTLITDTTDPAYFNMLDGDGTPDENYDIERIIWFCNPATAPATTIAEPTKTFYYRGSNSLRITPDGYSIIGPRQTTYLGSKPLQASGTDPANKYVNEPGSQSIILSGANDGRYTFNNTQSPGGLRRAGDSDFAVTAAIPSSYANSYDPDGAPTGIGLSVTEPLPNASYYPEPTVQNLAPNLTIYDLYTDGENLTDAPTIFCPDTPFDSDGGRGYPLSLSPALVDTGTHPDKSNKAAAEVIKDYKTAILQRLANPLSNHDAALNPYITVDHLGIDITVFNGEDSYQIHATEYTGTPTQDDWDPDESGDVDGNHARNSTDVYFASREKGRRDDNQSNNPSIAELEGSAATPSYSSGNYLGTLKRITANIVGNVGNMIPNYNQTPPIHPSPVDTGLVAGAPDSDEHFGRKLIHTLGYVNHNLGAQIQSAIAVNATYQYSPIPLESGRQPDPYTAGTAFACENNPLAWLNWPNSPYVSKYDLMMVPTSSPQRLLFEYSGARKNDTNTADIPFHFDSGSTNGDSLDAQLAPYAYLFNFFHGTKTDGLNPATPPGNDDKAMQLVRLFDFVHVPSRFNGTNKWYNISQFNPASGDLRTVSTKTEDARLGYMFPFNRRSEFREPGKINLNTIPSKKVYDSIFDPAFWDNAQNPDIDFASWDEFKASRRGYTGAADPAYPSDFSNPFRPAAAAEMMPVLHGGDKRLLVPPEEAGLLRSVNRNATPASNRTPLFDLRLTNSGLDNDKMRHYRTDDNPMLRYQAYQRLGNIAGTQSNVFAVWITIGYFEVEPVAVSPTHPDGWALAEELGNDTGEINRHRAFYIIDRSIPVGYVPGEDLNVEDTIMLKRFIE
ncbi:hypothetical protein [Bremerella sp.]|uniref:hypothetical protein n=1 Tax=Bremerella sp. TaxID=2795602 RepID=UPI00391C7894